MLRRRLFSTTFQPRIYDFRSDAATKPTAEMMAYVQRHLTRGDDIFEEDPSTQEFERELADLLGHEAALLGVSGTMTNQLALRVWSRGPLRSMVVDPRCHVYKYENGGAASLSQLPMTPVLPERVVGSSSYWLTKRQLAKHLLLPDVHVAHTQLISLENTLQGEVMPQQWVVDIRQWVDECNRRRPADDRLILHCDGARLLHAALAQRLPVKELARQFDSVSMCLSKGVGAPIGSVLVGSHDFIRQARHYRKWMGGAWRHSSMVALAAKWALEHTYHKKGDDGRCLLERTHDTTRYLASALETAVPGGGARPVNQLHTNMLYISFKQALAPHGLTLEQMLNEVAAVNDEAVARGEPSTVVATDAYSFDADGGRSSSNDDSDGHSAYVVRMVLHYQIDEHGCDLLAGRMKQAYQRLLSKP